MGADNIKFAKPALAKWQVVTRAEDKHVVYQPDGQVYGTYASKTQAAGIAGGKQKAADLALKRMKRSCMRCQKPFQSEGIHNRMCDYCLRQGGELVPHGVAPRNGWAR